MQSAHLAERQVGAGGVVGVGQEDDPRLVGHAAQHRIDIGRKVDLGRDARGPARGLHRDRIDQETVLAVDRLVAGTEVSLGDQLEDLVGPRPAHDPVRVEPIRLAERIAQRRRRSVRIERQRIRGRAVGLDRRGARPERRLVRRQLVELASAGRGGASGNIRGNAQHAWARRRPIGPDHALLPASSTGREARSKRGRPRCRAQSRRSGSRAGLRPPPAGDVPPRARRWVPRPVPRSCRWSPRSPALRPRRRV